MSLFPETSFRNEDCIFCFPPRGALPLTMEKLADFLPFFGWRNRMFDCTWKAKCPIFKEIVAGFSLKR